MDLNLNLNLKNEDNKKEKKPRKATMSQIFVIPKPMLKVINKKELQLKKKQKD